MTSRLAPTRFVPPVPDEEASRQAMELVSRNGRDGVAIDQLSVAALRPAQIQNSIGFGVFKKRQCFDGIPADAAPGVGFCGHQCREAGVLIAGRDTNDWREFLERQ